MLMLCAAVFLSLILGAATGGVLALLLLRRTPAPGKAPEPLDEWTAAAIDQAAAQWVTANHLPDEAAGLVADKLRLLHRLGSERRRTS